MRGSATFVRDDRGGALHDRYPIGIRRRRTEHATLDEQIDVFCARQQTHFSADGGTAHAVSAYELCAFLANDILLEKRRIVSRLDGFGPRLHDVERAVSTVAGPFH